MNSKIKLKKPSQEEKKIKEKKKTRESVQEVLFQIRVPEKRKITNEVKLSKK